MIRQRTDAPIYNEYYVFDLFCNLEELLSTKIVIAVYLKHFVRLKFHGSTSFEVALVWEQPDRQYYHKWAMLTNPKDLAAGPKGYVKCNIAINVKGEKLRVHPDTEGFLPTYGPSFLHFYGIGSSERNSCFGKCSTCLPFYRGRLLLSLKTEMDDPEASSGIGAETEPTPPIIEEQKLERLDGLVTLEQPDVYKLYNETIRTLENHCIRYLHTLDTERYGDQGGTTKLDRHRVNLCRKEIEDILTRIRINGELPNNRYTRIAMSHAYQYLKKLKKIQEDAFQLRAHIFQGRFDPGMDASGLLDPLVRVAFHGYTATTRAVKQTLDPFWDQTLILPPRTVHGTKEHIKLNPPRVVLQTFDQDICGNKEFCGRCTAIPLVKLAEETYSPPDFPPKLEWYKFKSQRDCSGSVLAAFELIEVEDDESVDRSMDSSEQDAIYNIPTDIRPKMANYRLEVIFWGVRDMKKIYYWPVMKPRIIIDCAGVNVKSEVMENAKKFDNFEEPHIIVSLGNKKLKAIECFIKFFSLRPNIKDMPELDIYYPSITIKAYDSRGFGCFKYAGICIVPSIHVFLEQLITEEHYDEQIYESKSIIKSQRSKKQSAAIHSVFLTTKAIFIFQERLPIDHHLSKNENQELIPYKKMIVNDKSSIYQKVLRSLKELLLCRRKKRKKEKFQSHSGNEDESLDWWSKYYASVEKEKSRQLGSFIREDRELPATFKVYDGELEMQPEFAGFQDRLRTFELWRGKKSGDPAYDRDNYVGKFKGRIAVYRWPHPDNLPCKTRSGRNAVNGLCDDYPPPELIRLLVRLYVVKGINLQPSDPLSRKSDPYLCINLGKTFINDKKNYKANQLNPTFGRLFEIEATFPRDYLLTIQVWDYDVTSSDDLIGETKIDLENRFYSRHRAACGISNSYSIDGYNAWRDREKPTQILQQLCKKNNLPSPEFGKDYVKIGRKRFPFVEDQDATSREERMALMVLHQWQDFPICGCALVPEHLERRPLFNTAKYGLEQGKLELWIDMFQFNELPAKPPVDITAPVPEEYEIRVIVWNTEDVPLVESQFLTGEKCSDIYVKGWFLYDDYQKTDIHYSSLNGEGNFNWRFVFRVSYSKRERVMIVRRKTSMLVGNEIEEKMPCKLNLQVWDSDHFSSDDFLGALTLDLARMPRGSSNSKNCTLKLLDPNLPTIDLFKMTRIKAWWPFALSVATGNYVQAGKVELEISVLRAEEADEQPAGKGRESPQNLPPPKYVN
ncbi:otoferlin-like [Osmia bicornis bicornis]|uniref:otoferlin-like n=1 Tax=Osmia bicornis bicornis TaxID=1437191 RepID=UPI001EAF2C5D|nr:otoferlin-like [Osmia bicornis bicornis]